MGIAITAVATPQVPDILRYSGQTYQVHPSPLTNYISVVMKGWSFEQMRAWDQNLTRSTACYRGFAAEWEVRNGELYLLSLRRPHASLRGVTPEIPLSALNTNWTGSVHANWFSGVLYEFKWSIRYFHASPIGGTYLAERQFHFTNGRLDSTELVIPWLTPWLKQSFPYLAVIACGVLLLTIVRIKRKKSHNQTSESTS